MCKKKLWFAMTGVTSTSKVGTNSIIVNDNLVKFLSFLVFAIACRMPSCMKIDDRLWEVIEFSQKVIAESIV
jgi:hypothetical protein